MAIALLMSKIRIKIILVSTLLFVTNLGHAVLSSSEKQEHFLNFSEEQGFPPALLNISGGSVPLTAFQIFANAYKIRIQKQLSDLCQRVDLNYKKLRWGKSPCFSLPLTYEFVSELGRPLVYWVFKNHVDSSLQKKNVTLILGGVHPDELTPIHLAFQFAETLHKNPALYKNAQVIVAPLVNPDGFFEYPPKRTNANGVDLNRNFPTQTWNKYAYEVWMKSKKKDKRKFPGSFANSEQGTRFQAALIAKFNPDKVISIHAPLAFLDLDYEIPKLFSISTNTEQLKKAKNLAKIISKGAGNYKIKNFGIYPGSLGNYAGNERIIPTITLELSSSYPKLVKKFWKDFSPGLLNALKYEINSSPLH
jgi:protein MpaA